MNEIWEHYDTRTGQRVAMAVCFTEEQARRTLEGWVARDKRGGRPDIHDLIPFISYRRVTA